MKTTVDNFMTDDYLWEEPKEKECNYCGYIKALCQCEDQYNDNN